MRRVALGLAAVALLGCAAGEEPAEEMEAAAAPAGLSAADMVGTWEITATGEGGESGVTYRMVATEDPATWTVQFGDMDPLPVQVSFDGDSVMTSFGPFPSQLREGVTVRSASGVSRLDGGMLMGTFVARYETTEADSVLYGTTHGMRNPQ